MVTGDGPRHHPFRLWVQGKWDMPGPPRKIQPVDPEPGADRDAPLAPASHLPPSDQGVEGNARLTGLNAGVLLALLAAEGATLLSIRQLVTPHVFIGMVLVPPVLLKIGSTGWRIARYYLGSPAYRAKGPPPLLLRLLGPAVVLLTVLVIGSGIALLLVPHSLRTQMLFWHKATFVLWFGAMALHVLGHLVDTTRLAPADLVRTTRRQIGGAGARLWAEAASLVIGCILGIVLLPAVGTWLASGGVVRGG